MGHWEALGCTGNSVFPQGYPPLPPPLRVRHRWAGTHHCWPHPPHLKDRPADLWPVPSPASGEMEAQPGWVQIRALFVGRGPYYWMAQACSIAHAVGPWDKIY